MGFNTISFQEHPITLEIYKIQHEIDALPWYSFIKRSALYNELGELEGLAIGIGIDQALKDLEQAELIKIINEGRK